MHDCVPLYFPKNQAKRTIAKHSRVLYRLHDSSSHGTNLFPTAIEIQNNSVRCFLKQRATKLNQISSKCNRHI